jgi:hypothetical protein
VSEAFAVDGVAVLVCCTALGLALIRNVPRPGLARPRLVWGGPDPVYLLAPGDKFVQLL